MKIESLAAAKINLALHVIGFNEERYHEIDSLVTFANIGDIIQVRPYNSLKLSIDGPFASSVPQGAENIIIKAAKFLSLDGKAHIRLTKNLPVQAGLGGGSADAAATLRSLSKLWNLPIPNSPEVLGADIPICLLSETAVVQGIGEKIMPVSIPEKLQIILIKPCTGLSTETVFKTLKEKNNKKMNPYLGTESKYIFKKHIKALRNDLLKPSIELAPIIKDVLSFLNTQNGIYFSQMSGSGTTCFGLFENKINALKALSNAKRKFPEMWCQTAQLL
ncbi:MAG: 4-(cytidine 5'-diphospho)-2-C-methyl-D-erythritol kinase [Rhodobacteraceae bacterium]|nr:4-(cytidine 5'-diphospho)-2-C-methyl-D-erythritol kinase [Paracoccaceae bacterium]